jgi:hypothetical protein
MILTHYIIARRDLTVGDLVAQVAHAAGESFFLLRPSTIRSLGLKPGCRGLIPAEGSTLIPGRLEKERSEEAVFAQVMGGAREVAGSSPAPGTHVIDIGNTIVVVLGAHNEYRLLPLEKELIQGAVAHVAIRETEGPHAGHLMSVGLVPAPKETVAHHLYEFHMLSECASQGSLQ